MAYPNSGFGTNGATSNSFLANYGNKNGFLDSFAKKTTPTQTPAPNMSTNSGPAYAPPPVLGSLGTTPVVKHTIATDGTQSVTHAVPATTAKNSPPAAKPAPSAPATQQPITGNTTTPSGAVVNATSGQMVTPPAPTSPNTYSGFIGALGQTAQQGNPQAQQATQGLIDRSSQPSPQYTQAYNNAQGYNSQLVSSLQNEAAAEAQNRLNPIPLGDQTGREAVIRQQYLAQQQALGAGFQGASNLISGANTQQGLQLTGLNQAGGLANQSQGLQQQGLTSGAQLSQPQLASYSQQSFNPLTNTFSGGGSVGDAVSTIAQKIQAGTMSYDQGVAALSGYGQAGVNGLQQALGPSFNVAQSNSLAGQQGTIGPAYEYAKQAVTNLQNAVKDLPDAQKTNVPLINLITQGASTAFGVGSQGVQAYKGALAEARSAIQKVLASVQGGTPTDYVGQSNALLPDNATPAQIDAASQTLDTLGKAKVSIYGNPGASTTNTNSNANTNITWDSLLK